MEKNAPSLEEIVKLFAQELREFQAENRQAQAENRSKWAQREQEHKQREEERKQREEKAEKERLKREEEYLQFRKRIDEERQQLEKESIRRMNQIEGVFIGKWGKLVEALVNNRIVPLLRERGIEVEQTAQRRKGCVNGQNFEFDIIAQNGDVIVIIEVKTTLTPDDVKDFLQRLAHAKEWLHEYTDKTIHGAVAFLHEDGNASKMAEKAGLFTIMATSSSAHITNPMDFTPKIF